MKKIKILNDPVYGFINIPNELILSIIDHPYFQRLRRIKQLGLTDFVYPGALHTRFHHALGSMHLMSTTLDNLRYKGTYISDEEYNSALIAILLHDIGHGPFSHTLEFTLLEKMSHEKLSLLLMGNLNTEFNNKLDTAIAIFKGSYPRQFLNKLVSSQLDMDRLDYLLRDSFYTGVSEGTIGAQRIIKLLNVINDDLVIEEKGLYSVENFLNARRLMYWQVYLHKTTISVEKMMNNLLSRAKYLAEKGHEIPASKSLSLFLNNTIKSESFLDEKYLQAYTSLDDNDIMASIKEWREFRDPILSYLSRSILERNLFKVQLWEKRVSKKEVSKLEKQIAKVFNVPSNEVSFLYSTGSISNAAYISEGKKINLLKKDGSVIDIKDATDLPNIAAMSKIVKKYYLSFPRNIPF